MPAEIEYFFHEADALVFARAAQTIDAREEFEILRDVEIAVERECLRHVTEAIASLRAIAAKIETRDPSFPAGGLEEPAQHLESCGLAGAVRSEQPENLPARNLEADVFGGGEVAKALSEAARLDDWLRLVHCARQRQPPRASIDRPGRHRACR